MVYLVAKWIWIYWLHWRTQTHTHYNLKRNETFIQIYAQNENVFKPFSYSIIYTYCRSLKYKNTVEFILKYGNLFWLLTSPGVCMLYVCSSCRYVVGLTSRELNMWIVPNSPNQEIVCHWERERERVRETHRQNQCAWSFNPWLVTEWIVRTYTTPWKCGIRMAISWDWFSHRFDVESELSKWE